MKKWNAIGFFAVLIIGMGLISGCINNTGSSGVASTPTPQIVYVTVLVTPIPGIITPTTPQQMTNTNPQWGSSGSVKVETSTIDPDVIVSIDSTHINQIVVNGGYQIANSGGDRIADVKGRFTNNKNVVINVMGWCKSVDDRGALLASSVISSNTIAANGGVGLFRASIPLGMDYDNAKVVCYITNVYKM